MTQFRVLTAREQSTLNKTLEKANAAILLVASILSGEPKVRKVRKPRKAKAGKAAPAAAPAGKRKPGRPPKAAAEEVTI